MHHQVTEVLRQLQRHGLVIFIGARGTGKTSLADAIEDSLEPGTLCCTLDVQRAGSLEDLLMPVAQHLGGSDDAVTFDALPPGRMLHVTIDRCEALYEAPWLEQFQDVWRALATSDEARGRLTTLMLGRPQMRRVLGGEASPLANVACITRARPITAVELEVTLGADSRLARAVIRKTGGHPRLSDELLRAAEGRVEGLGTAYGIFVESFGDYLISLIEDHGVAAPNVVSDIVRMKASVSESALLERHFPSSRGQGASMLDDLAASGIVAKTDEGCYRLAAEIAASDRVTAVAEAGWVEVPSRAPDQHPVAGALMYEFENGLRARVVESLSATDRDWWTSKVPEAIAVKAESKRSAERELSTGASASWHPICYLELGELADVIKTDANWRQVFGVSFRIERDEFSGIMSRVASVRNKVAHNRPVTGVDVALLREAAVQLELTSASTPQGGD